MYNSELGIKKEHISVGFTKNKNILQKSNYQLTVNFFIPPEHKITSQWNYHLKRMT